VRMLASWKVQERPVTGPVVASVKLTVSPA